MALKRTVFCLVTCGLLVGSLTSESVEGTSLPLEGIDYIHGSDGLPLGVFSVGNGITDDVLKEDLEDSTSLFVDQARDTLDSTTCLLYTSPSPRDRQKSRMPSSA